MDRSINSIDDKQTIYEIYRSCRLCGVGAGYKMPIIQNVIPMEGEDMNLKQKIEDCLQLQIDPQDRMPPLVCELCVDKVNDFYEFLDIVRQTNTKTRIRLGLPLHSKIKTSKSEDDSDDSKPIVIHGDDSDGEPLVKKTKKKTKKEEEKPKPEPNTSKPKEKISRELSTLLGITISKKKVEKDKSPSPMPRRREKSPTPKPRRNQSPSPKPRRKEPSPTPRSRRKESPRPRTEDINPSSRTRRKEKSPSPRPRRKEPSPRPSIKEPSPSLRPRRKEKSPSPKRSTRSRLSSEIDNTDFKMQDLVKKVVTREVLKKPEPEIKKTPVTKPGPKSKKTEPEVQKPIPKPGPKSKKPEPKPELTLSKLKRTKEKEVSNESPPAKKSKPTESKAPSKTVQQTKPQVSEKETSSTCPVCQMEYKSMSKYLSHMLLHMVHFTPEKNACNACKEWFTRSNTAAAHHMKHRYYYCATCKVSYKTYQQFNDHIANNKCISEPVKSEVKCSECWRIFATRKLLEYHKCLGEDGRLGGKCSKCNRKYTLFKNLTKHESTCTFQKEAAISIDPDVQSSLLPMEVRISKCDDLLDNGRAYNVSALSNTFGLDIHAYYPYLPLFDPKIVSIKNEFTQEYLNWNSYNTSVDGNISVNIDDEFGDNESVASNLIDNVSVNSLSDLSLKKVNDGLGYKKEVENHKKQTIKSKIDNILNRFDTCSLDSDSILEKGADIDALIPEPDENRPSSGVAESFLGFDDVSTNKQLDSEEKVDGNDDNSQSLTDCDENISENLENNEGVDENNRSTLIRPEKERLKDDTTENHEVETNKENNEMVENAESNYSNKDSEKSSPKPLTENHDTKLDDKISNPDDNLTEKSENTVECKKQTDKFEIGYEKTDTINNIETINQDNIESVPKKLSSTVENDQKVVNGVADSSLDESINNDIEMTNDDTHKNSEIINKTVEQNNKMTEFVNDTHIDETSIPVEVEDKINSEIINETVEPNTKMREIVNDETSESVEVEDKINREIINETVEPNTKMTEFVNDEISKPVEVEDKTNSEIIKETVEQNTKITEFVNDETSKPVDIENKINSEYDALSSDDESIDKTDQKNDVTDSLNDTQNTNDTFKPEDDVLSFKMNDNTSVNSFDFNVPNTNISKEDKFNMNTLSDDDRRLIADLDEQIGDDRIDRKNDLEDISDTEFDFNV